MDVFHLDHTYAGLILGKPSPEMNAKILKKAVPDIEKIWGENRAIHMIPPTIRHDKETEILPPIINYAWLDSKPLNPEFDGSSLIVIWFSQNQLELPLGDIVTNAIQDIDWKTLARDYHF